MDTNDFYSISRTTSNVYLFFSGNGLANNKEFYLDCANTIAKDVQNMAYPMSVVRANSQGYPSYSPNCLMSLIFLKIDFYLDKAPKKFIM